MKDEQRQNRRAKPKPRSDASEIGRVRVFSNPGPDAEDRLRRLMSLMIRYATEDGLDEQQDGNRPPDERGSDDPAEAEA